MESENCIKCDELLKQKKDSAIFYCFKCEEEIRIKDYMNSIFG